MDRTPSEKRSTAFQFIDQGEFHAAANSADLTASNLSQALSLEPSTITSLETEVIGQGVGILCQLARVKFSYKEGARGPKSVVAKFPAAIEQTRGLVRQFKFFEREVNFYKHLYKDVSLT